MDRWDDGRRVHGMSAIGGHKLELDRLIISRSIRSRCLHHQIRALAVVGPGRRRTYGTASSRPASGASGTSVQTRWPAGARRPPPVYGRYGYTGGEDGKGPTRPCAGDQNGIYTPPLLTLSIGRPECIDHRYDHGVFPTMDHHYCKALARCMLSVLMVFGAMHAHASNQILACMHGMLLLGHQARPQCALLG